MSCFDILRCSAVRLPFLSAAIVWLLSASACGTRPLLPTLTLHALLTLRRAAMDAGPKAGSDFGLQAQLSFRPRGKPHPRLRQRSEPLPMSMPLPVAPDCQQAQLCEWAELAEESALAALGVSP